MTQFTDLDRRIADTMACIGVPALRVSLATIFIWFGLLKPLGLSPAQALVETTVGWMPLFRPTQWVSVIGWCCVSEAHSRRMPAGGGPVWAY